MVVYNVVVNCWVSYTSLSWQNIKFVKNPHCTFYRSRLSFFFFFFLKDPAPTEIYTFPLHDALPISRIGFYDFQKVRFLRGGDSCPRPRTAVWSRLEPGRGVSTHSCPGPMTSSGSAVSCESCTSQIGRAHV